MNRWQRLHAEIEDAREQQAKYNLSLVTVVIKRLSDRDHCDNSAVHWLSTARGPGGSIVYEWSRSADAQDDRGHAALQLRNISWLPGSAIFDDELRRGPVLSLRVVLDRKERVRSFSAGIKGVRATGERWYARIELTEQPEGQGHCGHPLLHAHVGDDPDAALSPRVPVPWLLPHEALEWLLATVDPALEPAP